MDNPKCKNCGTPVTGNFCSDCGQRYLITPYSREIIPFLLSQTIDFGVNYFKTLGTLFVKPNRVVTSFLSGNVKKYVNPLKYLVLSVAALIIIDWLEAYITNDPEGASEAMELPLYGVLGTAILYLIIMQKLLWKSYSWVEHLIIGIYLAIQMLVISIIIFTIISLMSKLVEFESNNADLFSYSSILMVGYYFYYMVSVFSKLRLIAFLKSILILILGFVLLTIGVALFGIATST